MADYVLVDMFAEAVTGQRYAGRGRRHGRAARQPLLPRLTRGMRPVIDRHAAALFAKRWLAVRRVLSTPPAARIATVPRRGLRSMLPAAVLLLVFLTYPLGLGVWLGFTDDQIGRPGIFIGLENYEYLWTTASSGSRSSTRCSTPSSPRS